MTIDLKPGKYVVAVSGGVDSVVLLDLLSKEKNYELLVAHFDHGIRQDSVLDADFVSSLANKYGLEFFVEKGELGPKTSEATARDARYKFLDNVKTKASAHAIITAHHQDDLLETAILNILRGTTARGLGSLKSSGQLQRPLLNMQKSEIIDYAVNNNLDWREDESNQNQKYLRNYIRHAVVPKISAFKKAALFSEIKKSVQSTAQIDQIVLSLVDLAKPLKRSEFVILPNSVAQEVLASWLRRENLKIDQKTVERLTISLKTAKNKAKIDINNNAYFIVEKGIIYMKKY